MLTVQEDRLWFEYFLIGLVSIKDESLSSHGGEINSLVGQQDGRDLWQNCVDLGRGGKINVNVKEEQQRANGQTGHASTFSFSLNNPPSRKGNISNLGEIVEGSHGGLVARIGCQFRLPLGQIATAMAGLARQHGGAESGQEAHECHSREQH